MPQEDQNKNEEKENKKPLNKRFLILAIIFLVVVAVVTWFLIRSTGSEQSGQVEGIKEEAQEVEKAKTVPESKYFSEDAKIMYFYSDGCHWCQEEKKILGELGYEGYKFKPMNVGEDTSLWERYEISGTPTFIAENDDRLIGYREKAELKKWIDKHLK
jgi:hypothetical protein